MCRLNPEMLQLYIDSELNSLEKFLLEEHLKDCTSCRKELNRLKILDWDFNSMAEKIDIPAQLLSLRISTLDQHIKEAQEEAEPTFGLKEVYELQYNTLKNTVNFIQYLPGNRLLTSSGRKLSKRLKPTFLSKIIGL
ncbi:MAG: hypothetical protein JM58_16455 [Peptococcaceae bacterium BICA1-8]|nr:MAG: hypothetical protein JM58_16455 [Peptococcaceae bacterium BICA1-8]